MYTSQFPLNKSLTNTLPAYLCHKTIPKDRWNNPEVQKNPDRFLGLEMLQSVIRSRSHAHLPHASSHTDAETRPKHSSTLSLLGPWQERGRDTTHEVGIMYHTRPQTLALKQDLNTHPQFNFLRAWQERSRDTTQADGTKTTHTPTQNQVRGNLPVTQRERHSEHSDTDTLSSTKACGLDSPEARVERASGWCCWAPVGRAQAVRAAGAGPGTAGWRVGAWPCGGGRWVTGWRGSCCPHTPPRSRPLRPAGWWGVMGSAAPSGPAGSQCCWRWECGGPLGPALVTGRCCKTHNSSGLVSRVVMGRCCKTHNGSGLVSSVVMGRCCKINKGPGHVSCKTHKGSGHVSSIGMGRCCKTHKGSGHVTCKTHKGSGHVSCAVMGRCCKT